MGHTYGTWLPGDPRGFRVRGRRERVEGDYKSPPPTGKYEGLHRYTKSVMRRKPVHLDKQQQRLAVQFLVESKLRRKIDVVTASVDSVHFHILSRFKDRRPDHWIGVAKKETSHLMKEAGACAAGGLWAKCQPIANRKHQLATAKYILDHRKQGAAVWF